MYKNIKIGIYCIENKINNKKYIGQSVNIYARWNHHKNELKHGVHDNDYLQKSWIKYGKENFDFYIVKECLIDELDDYERYYIDLFDSTNKDLGYNLTTGGQENSKFVSDEIKKKKSESLKKYYEENPDVKRAKSESAKKQWADPETRAKISGENSPLWGRKLTDEQKKKLSDAQKGTISPQRNTNKVICVETNIVYECACVAAKELNIRSGGILQVCYGNRKTCGGYHWKFFIVEN